MDDARFPRAKWLRGIGILLGAVAIGCEPGEPLQQAGVKVAVGKFWQPMGANHWKVPGQALAAWSGPQDSSFVIYQTMPVPGVPSSEVLSAALVNRLTNLPSLQILDHKPLTVGGIPAARIELVAQGFGDAIAPSGAGVPVSVDGKSLRPTRQTTVVISRRSSPLYLTWHAPESSWPEIAPEIDAILGKISLGPDSAPRTSSYSRP